MCENLQSVPTNLAGIVGSYFKCRKMLFLSVPFL